MSNNKQSSIDFFWNQLPEILPFTVDTETAVKLWEAFEQAKEMQKEERAESYADGYSQGYKRGVDYMAWKNTNEVQVIKNESNN
jgi:hypothetical protein